MTNTNIRAKVVAAAVLLSIASTRNVAAQWSVGAYGVTEYDTKHTLLVLAGVGASPKGTGLKPMFGLQAYHLSYDAGVSRTNVFSFRPAIGMVNDYRGGALTGSVGYALENNEIAGPVVSTARGQGVVVNGDWDHWGTGGPIAYQVLGSYNFGGSDFWGRAGASTRISRNGSSRIGAEVAYLAGTGYSAWQPGGVYEWHMRSGLVLGAGSGAKFMSPGGTAMYFKLQAYLPVVR